MLEYTPASGWWDSACTRMHTCIKKASPKRVLSHYRERIQWLPPHSKQKCSSHGRAYSTLHRSNRLSVIDAGVACQKIIRNLNNKTLKARITKLLETTSSNPNPPPNPPPIHPGSCFEFGLHGGARRPRRRKQWMLHGKPPMLPW